MFERRRLFPGVDITDREADDIRRPDAALPF